jgi:uncharacterized protein (TIGR00251 family)
MMIEITEDESGVTIPLRVQPKASSDRIAGEHAGSLKVSVTAPPERGRANAAVIRLLAKKLNVSKNCITVIAGENSRRKKIHVDNMNASQVEKRLSLVSSE